MVSRASTNNVACLGPVPSWRSVIGVGYVDGQFEYRYVPTLQVTNELDSLFPGCFTSQIVEGKRAVESMEDIDMFFNEEADTVVAKPPRVIGTGRVQHGPMLLFWKAICEQIESVQTKDPIIEEKIFTSGKFDPQPFSLGINAIKG